MHLDGITDDDWDLAGVVIAMSDRTRQAVIDAAARERSQANEQRGHADAVRAVIIADETDRRGIQRTCRLIVTRLGRVERESHSALRSYVGKRNRPYFEEAIETLLNREEIRRDATERNLNGHGGPGEFYRRAE
jgi:hypothetical protein